ncbi:MAG: hypothetical protein ACJ75S_06715 [Solirubrobacterales bacterium]|jgi:hypothetical protein
MASKNLKVRSGNRVVVKLDGKDVGLIQSVRMSDDYSPEPASGIGDIHVAEYVPTMARHSLSISNMVLFVGAMREAGLSALDGDDVLQGKVFDIVVYSKDDGSELRKYMGCSYASGDVEVNKHAILMSNGMFNALNVSGTGL